MTLKSALAGLREKHWKIVESSGSIGIIGIAIAGLAAVLLLWKPFLGAFLSKVVALVLLVLVPIFNL